MKKIDGRSVKARALKAKTEAATAAQYAANMQTHADGSFTGQTGKTYKAMEFTPQPHHTASEYQIGGNHYKNLGVEPWDAIQAWMSPESFAGFLRGSAIKYVARCDKKGGLEDIKKAQHYLEKLIEVLS